MKKLLVVDDSRTIISFLKKELKNYEMIKPFYALTYKEAERIIKEEKGEFHGALLDLSLPDALDGEIVDLANAYHIPAVILTGLLDEKLKESVLKKDVVDYVVKKDLSSISCSVQAISRTLKNYDTTVLIVDDARLYRESIAKSLRKVYINTLEAKDGVEALEILNSNNNISLVVTDYEMPNMDGLTLTLKIREKYKKDTIGIIAISSASEQDIITRFLKFGANDFIHKPFSHNEVVTRINSNLELLDMFAQIKDLANKDFLTGAYNRRYFFDVGKAIYLKAKRKKSSLAVAMIDIDNFKNVNDTYGHDVGDVAIQEIKTILDKILRASDLMARFGGEEFCVVLEDITKEETNLLFERVRKSFEDNTIDTHNVTISYTVSIGVYYGLGDSLEDMIRLSDEALYTSKETGRNKVTII